MFPTIRNTAVAAVALLAATSNYSHEFLEQLADVATTLSTDIFNEPDDNYLHAIDATFDWEIEEQEELLRALTIIAGIQRDPLYTAGEKYVAARLTMARLKIIAFEAGC